MKLDVVKRRYVAFSNEDRGRYKCLLSPYIFIFLLLSSFFSLSLSAQGLSEQEIIQKMSAAAGAIRTVRCDFTQTRYTKMLKGAQVSKGRMSCELPGKLRWEYTSPVGSAIIMEGSNVRIEEGGKVKEAKNSFVAEMARMIMNSVAGKCLTDSKAFQVSAQEMPTEYVATLLPLRKDMRRMYSKLVLHFNLRQSTVTEVELHERNGDRTIIELQDIHINEEDR